MMRWMNNMPRKWQLKITKLRENKQYLQKTYFSWYFSELLGKVGPLKSEVQTLISGLKSRFCRIPSFGFVRISFSRGWQLTALYELTFEHAVDLTWISSPTAAGGTSETKSSPLNIVNNKKRLNVYVVSNPTEYDRSIRYTYSQKRRRSEGEGAKRTEAYTKFQMVFDREWKVVVHAGHRWDMQLQLPNAAHPGRSTNSPLGEYAIS